MNLIKAKLSEKLIEYIDKNSLWNIAIYLFVFVLVCMAAGALIFWLWKRHKIKAETKKILKETEKISLELIEKRISFIEKIKPYKEHYRNNFELLNLSLRATIDSVSAQNVHELDANREEAIRVFCTDLVPSFVDYCEMAMSINNASENKFFLANEIFPFIQLSIKFINTVNMDFIVDMVNKTKMSIRNETLSSLYHIVEPNMSMFWIIHQRNYRKLKEELHEATS